MEGDVWQGVTEFHTQDSIAESMAIKVLIDSIEMRCLTDDAGKDSYHHTSYEPFCPAFDIQKVVLRDLDFGCGLFSLEFRQEFVGCFVLTYPYLGNA